MKRLFMSGLAFLLIIVALNTGGFASAATGDNEDEELRSQGLFAPPLTVQINGSVVNAPANMNVIEGQVMVPLRWAAGQLGASSVEWDAAARTVTIQTGEDFYSIEKFSSYARALQTGIDEPNERIWPLPDKARNLQLPDLVSNRHWVLELEQFKPERVGLALPGPSSYINIHITSDDGIYEHSSVVHSIENYQDHYYLPMDWLEYLFNAKVNYNEAANILSLQTPELEQIKSQIERIENALIPDSGDEAVKLWGRGEQTRNGALQYAALSPQLRQEADKSAYVRQSYWVTGSSSPQVGPITIESRNKLSDTKIEYTLSFPLIFSGQTHTLATEKMVVEKLSCNGQAGWFITELLQSSGHGIIEGNASSPDSKNLDRFARAEDYGQFIQVNKTVDCKGTRVCIEKILLDKTHTFMIARVDGDIRGMMDSLCVDLFDERGLELGRSSFLQKLPDGKTLLTFDSVQKAPEALRMEFFGGPVGYGGHVILTLNDISFKKVDRKYNQEYRLSETVENEGYQLLVDSIQKGISETSIHYKLAVLGDYDGIKHGWLYDWYNNYSPEGEIISLYDNGRRLGGHLSSINCLGPYYRVSQDRKAMVGRANFDGMDTSNPKLQLSDIYAYYNINTIIPLDGVKDKLDINQEIQVSKYIVHLNLFTRGADQETWILDYSVRDSAGNKIDAAIEADICMKTDDYRMPMTFFKHFYDTTKGNRCLVFKWQPPESQDSFILGPAIKISKLGIKQEDAQLEIDLNNLNNQVENQDELEIMAAINDYYNTFGRALVSNDIMVFEQKFGYLEPTGKGWDGVNDWQHQFQSWRQPGVKDYIFTFQDPIITVTGNQATVDLAGHEKITRNDGNSAGGFSTVFYLEKVEGKWTIGKIDELTEAEIHGVN